MTMLPHFDTEHVTVWHGDCIDVMRGLPDASVDAVVTDPPYGLEFMGREWDGADGFRRSLNAADVGRENTFGRMSAKAPEYRAGTLFQDWCELWAIEALRVLKPGGHLLAFGGTRTFHRLTAGIEDAGFEIRDSLAWMYGQGFPKSADPGCRCDPEPQTEHDLPSVLDTDVPAAVPARSGSGPLLLEGVPEPGASQHGATPGTGRPGIEECVLEGRRDVQTPVRELHPPADGPMPAGVRIDGPLERIHPTAPARHGAMDWSAVDPLGVREPHRPRHGEQRSEQPRAVPVEPGPQARGAWPVCGRCGKPTVTGLGSALKPSFEPVVVARKPLTGTLAATVAQYGTGALNIDASRIAGENPSIARRQGSTAHLSTRPAADTEAEGRMVSRQSPEAYSAPRAGESLGRWPANVVLDASQAAALDQQSGVLTSGANPTRRSSDKVRDTYGEFKGQTEITPARGADSGGASRFFKTVDDVTPRFMYTAKAGSDERPGVDGIAHPTVKPVDLMRWLVRLVTPKGGVVLEPFAGSGTTVEAAVLEGFRCIAIEREADYLPLIMQRVSKPHAVGLDFGDWEDAS